MDLRPRVLQGTVEEVASCEGDGVQVCVICLDQVAEKAIAKPCGHASFDFLCLASWLQERPACPLCKTEVSSVSYDLGSRQGPKIYRLNLSPDKQSVQPSNPRTRLSSNPHRRRYPARRYYEPAPTPSDFLLRRRFIYRNRLYSLHVGSNRISKFRELTPKEFRSDEDLISRARKWVRRELQVFEFLNPDASEQDMSDERPQRRANNAAFLLEYILAILKTVDIKGSGGQAEELLQEFLGRQNTQLFLHELRAWLRSPFNSLDDWDRAVQYDEALATQPASHTSHPHADIEAEVRYAQRSPRRGHAAYRAPQRGVGKPKVKSSWNRRTEGNRAQSRRLEAAQKRYEPD